MKADKTLAEWVEGQLEEDSTPDMIAAFIVRLLIGVSRLKTVLRVRNNVFQAKKKKCNRNIAFRSDASVLYEIRSEE